MAAGNMETLQLAKMSVEQVLERHGSNLRSVVVNSVVDSVRRHVLPFLDGKALLQGRGGSTGRMHLVKRLAEQAIYMGGNETLSDLLKLLAMDECQASEVAQDVKRDLEKLVASKFKGAPDRALSGDDARKLANDVLEFAAKTLAGRSGAHLMEEIEQSPDVFVQSVVTTWKNKLDTYVPTLESNGYDRYAKKTDTERVFEDQVPGLLEELNARYACRTQRAYDRARMAKVRGATAHDLPVIAALYQSAVLRDTALSLLLARPGDTNESIHKRINLFRRRIAKGVFIREVTEESLEREMSSAHAEETGLQLNVQVLETEDPDYVASRGHGILAFASHYGPMAAESRKQWDRRRRTLCDYLERGETKGKAAYADAQKKEFLLAHLDDLILCGDIRGVEQFAPERLGAHVFANMMHEHDLDPADADKTRDKTLLAYRLHHLKLACSKPVIRDLNAVGISLENDSSEELMISWGFTHASFDQNKRREGPHVRTVIDPDSGAAFRLNPVWQMMHASLRETDAAATELWARRGQRTHGDVTVDRPKKPTIRWRPPST
jgi:hypothetical protein